MQAMSTMLGLTSLQTDARMLRCTHALSGALSGAVNAGLANQADRNMRAARGMHVSSGTLPGSCAAAGALTPGLMALTSAGTSDASIVEVWWAVLRQACRVPGTLLPRPRDHGVQEIGALHHTATLMFQACSALCCVSQRDSQQALVPVTTWGPAGTGVWHEQSCMHLPLPKWLCTVNMGQRCRQSSQI